MDIVGSLLKERSKLLDELESVRAELQRARLAVELAEATADYYGTPVVKESYMRFVHALDAYRAAKAAAHGQHA